MSGLGGKTNNSNPKARCHLAGLQVTISVKINTKGPVLESCPYPPVLTCCILSDSSSRSRRVRSRRSICSLFSQAACSCVSACCSFSTFST